METITFKDVEKAYHKWAWHFQNNKFEHWELINGAWLCGKIRNWPKSDIKKASMRIKNDMIDYMRSVTDYRICRKREKRGLSFSSERCFTSIMKNIKGEDEDNIPVIANGFVLDKNVEKMELRDFVNFVIKSIYMTKAERLLLKLMYIGGYSQKEAAKICGYHEARSSQLHSSLMLRLRARFNNSDLKYII